MNFKEILDAKTDRAEAVLRKYLPEAEGFSGKVTEAMNYSVTAGGKRLRPVLLEESFFLFGGEGKTAEPFMAALEMIHNYSLVHDDLPAMDNDEYRRGRKTTWKVYGDGMAVLAGDGLLNLAYETAASAFTQAEDPKAMERAAAALKVLSRKAGIGGMIGGQTVDVELTGKPVPEEKLDFIYRLKTGALLEASMMIGAVLGGADREQTALMEQTASDVGLAFQIQDDILDVTSTVEELGKPVRSDEKNEKTTYVTLMGLEQAGKDVERISKDAIAGLDRLKAENEFLRELVLSLIDRRK